MNTQYYYDQTAHEYESKLQNTYWKLYDHLTWANIRMWLPNNCKTVLDVGGGTGKWARQLAKLGINVFVLDNSIGMLNEGKVLAAKEGLQQMINFIQFDIENTLPFNDEYFDFVIAQGDILSYIQSPEKVTHEISRVCKKDKMFQVSFDSFWFNLNKYYELKQYDVVDLLLGSNKSPFANGIFFQHNLSITDFAKICNNVQCIIVDIIGKPVLSAMCNRNQIIDMCETDYDQVISIENSFGRLIHLAEFSEHIQITVKKA